MKKLILFISFICLAAFASGAELKGGHIGCLTEEAFKETMMAAGLKDEQGFQYHFNKGTCVITKPGLSVSILDVRIFSGRVKVRVYTDERSFEMWTPMENIKEN
jgi:hypothetical protein